MSLYYQKILGVVWVLNRRAIRVHLNKIYNEK